jgi:hypothetical protein
VTITRIAPVTEQLILSFIAEKVLDLPKSYWAPKGDSRDGPKKRVQARAVQRGP